MSGEYNERESVRSSEGSRETYWENPWDIMAERYWAEREQQKLSTQRAMGELAATAVIAPSPLLGETLALIDLTIGELPAGEREWAEDETIELRKAA